MTISNVYAFLRLTCPPKNGPRPAASTISMEPQPKSQDLSPGRRVGGASASDAQGWCSFCLPGIGSTEHTNDREQSSSRR